MCDPTDDPKTWPRGVPDTSMRPPRWTPSSQAPPPVPGPPSVPQGLCPEAERELQRSLPAKVEVQRQELTELGEKMDRLAAGLKTVASNVSRHIAIEAYRHAERMAVPRVTLVISLVALVMAGGGLWLGLLNWQAMLHLSATPRVIVAEPQPELPTVWR